MKKSKEDENARKSVNFVIRIAWVIISLLPLAVITAILFTDKYDNLSILFFLIPLCVLLSIVLAVYTEQYTKHIVTYTVTKLKITSAKELALSFSYLRNLKRTYLKLKLVLFTCATIFLSLTWKFPQINLFEISIILLVLIGLLASKEMILAYRIQKGLFGTNRTEARALIEFIIKHSEDIDFTDSNGKLRRVLLPEVKSSGTEQVVPPFGEEAPA